MSNRKRKRKTRFSSLKFDEGETEFGDDDDVFDAKLSAGRAKLRGFSPPPQFLEDSLLSVPHDKLSNNEYAIPINLDDLFRANDDVFEQKLSAGRKKIAAIKTPSSPT